MHRIVRSSSQSLIISAVLVLVLALVFSCSDQPTGVKPASDGSVGSTKIDPGVSGSFLLGSVCDTPATQARIEVWGSNVAFDSATGIVSFDVRLVNKSRRVLTPTIHFVITEIIPADIALVGFDGVSGDGFPYMDFSTKLGSDNVLSPGEASDSVMVKFHTVTARSFAINFRVDFGPAAGGAEISGVVFRDDNQDGARGAGEPGIPDITLVLEKSPPSETFAAVIARTDANGAYKFQNLREGVYNVSVIVPQERFKLTTKSPLLVTLVKGQDGVVHDFTGADFGLFPLVQPPTDVLFGPIIIGPESRFGEVLDSTFVNPPSPLTVVFHYVLDVDYPPYMRPTMGVIDSAGAWINGHKVFEYVRGATDSTAASDSTSFRPREVKIPDGVVVFGDNTIRLMTKGDPHTSLWWRVRRVI